MFRYFSLTGLRRNTTTTSTFKDSPSKSPSSNKTSKRQSSLNRNIEEEEDEEPEELQEADLHRKKNASLTKNLQAKLEAGYFSS